MMGKRKEKEPASTCGFPEERGGRKEGKRGGEKEKETTTKPCLLS